MYYGVSLFETSICIYLKFNRNEFIFIFQHDLILSESLNKAIEVIKLKTINYTLKQVLTLLILGYCT